MAVKTATFRGMRYEIKIIGPIDGVSDCPTDKGKPVLMVCVDIDSKRGLEALIHEALHASCWAKSEEIVSQTAKDIARFLRRLGFRRGK